MTQASGIRRGDVVRCCADGDNMLVVRIYPISGNVLCVRVDEEGHARNEVHAWRTLTIALYGREGRDERMRRTEL